MNYTTTTILPSRSCFSSSFFTTILRNGYFLIYISLSLLLSLSLSLSFKPASYIIILQKPRATFECTYIIFQNKNVIWRAVNKWHEIVFKRTIFVLFSSFTVRGWYFTKDKEKNKHHTTFPIFIPIKSCKKYNERKMNQMFNIVEEMVKILLL